MKALSYVADTFNSLSRDHRLLRELEGRIFDHTAFQLPLSGSQVDSNNLQSCDTSGPSLSTPSLGITGKDEVLRHLTTKKNLSTPSLGITVQAVAQVVEARYDPAFNSLSRDHLVMLILAGTIAVLFLFFQLPLSGSRRERTCANRQFVFAPDLSTPSLGITGCDKNDFRRQEQKGFQLPLSGSRVLRYRGGL